ncbi:hypothetical protein LguiB_002024 [Lonicera macranthoides]
MVNNWTVDTVSATSTRSPDLFWINLVTAAFRGMWEISYSLFGVSQVGDRPFTDIVYGNRNGFLTILTEPLSLAEEPFIVKQPFWVRTWDVTYGIKADPDQQPHGFVVIVSLVCAADYELESLVRKLEVALVNRWYRKGCRPNSHRLLPDAQQCFNLAFQGRLCFFLLDCEGWDFPKARPLIVEQASNQENLIGTSDLDQHSESASTLTASFTVSYGSGVSTDTPFFGAKFVAKTLRDYFSNE